MAQLPPGFVLDAAPTPMSGGGAALPPGFELDAPASPDFDAADQQFRDMPEQPQLRSAMADLAQREREGDGVVMNATAGLNEGIYGTLGAPVDLASGAINMGVRGINAVTGSDIPTIDNPIGGSRSIAQAFGTVGVPDPADIEAVGAGGRIARGAGQGAGYMIAPEAAARGVLQAAGRTMGPWLSTILGGSRTAGDVAGNVVTGAAGGAGASFAGQVAPESVRPVAEMAGALVGGGVGALAAEVPRLTTAAVRAAGDYIAPLTAAGQERIAATAVRDAASDPSAARDALSRNAELVPGSQPTTFQQSGDMGLGGLERATATRAPEQFMQRRADQNTARLSALGDIQADGSPQAVVGALRANLADLDQMTGEALEATTRAARERAAAIGGTGTPESYGGTIRQQLMDAEASVREREGALWKAVDPDGTLALPTTGIRDEVVAALRSLPNSAKPMEGEERSIFAAAAGYGKVMPFSEVTALRSRVSTEMRRELSQNGRTPVYARLSQLRGAIERNIEAAVEGKAAQEAEAVASGAMRQEDTIAAMLEFMGRQRDEWTATRSADAVGQENGAGAPTAFGYSGGRDSGVPGVRGTAGATRGEFRGGSGDPRLSGADGLAPNFDTGAQERLKAASTATKERAQTFGRGPVGDVLRRSGSDGPFAVQNSIVPERFFRPGPRGYEDVQAVRQAANTPEAMTAIRDYAISTLRKAAEREDGILDPAKVLAWKSRHSDALRAFPEINGMLADPVRAAEAVAQVATQRKQSLDNFRQGVVGRLLGIENPEDVTRAIGAVFTSPQPAKTMRQLAEQVRGNPDAEMGLRKAVADHMTQRLVSNTEAAASGQALLKADQFQNFIRQNEAALRETLKPGEITVLKAIAADLQRANRSIASVKLPGGSNTAQDTLALARSSQPQSWLSIMLASAAQGTGLAVLGGPVVGTAGAVGGLAVGALRRAGMERVDQIIAEAMLNPAQGLLLLTKAPAKPTPEEGLAFAQRFARAMAMPADGENKADGQPLRVTVP